MEEEKLNFRIALTADQKQDLLKSVSDLKREAGLQDEDLTYSEDSSSSELKDLYFEPVTASAVGIYVLNIAVSGAASWIIAKALDRFFSANPKSEMAQDSAVVVLMPDGSVKKLDPRQAEELAKALSLIENAS